MKQLLNTPYKMATYDIFMSECGTNPSQNILPTGVVEWIDFNDKMVKFVEEQCAKSTEIYKYYEFNQDTDFNSHDNIQTTLSNHCKEMFSDRIYLSNKTKIKFKKLPNGSDFMCNGDICCNNRFFIEIKTKENMEHLKELSFVQSYNMKDKNINKLSVKVIKQVYAYLWYGRTRYCIISTYERSWCLFLDYKNVLNISNEINLDNLNQSIYYMLDLLLNVSLDYDENDNNNDQKQMQIKDQDKDEKDNRSMASSMVLRQRVLNKQLNTQKKYQTDKDNQSESSQNSSESSSASNENEKYNTNEINDSAYCGSNSNLNMVISKDDIFNRLPYGKVVGWGACGTVSKIFHYKQHFAVKFCDLYKTSDDHINQLKNEVEILKYLNSKQLEFVPTIYFNDVVTIFDCIVISFIEGHVIEYNKMTPVQKEKAIKNVEKLHELFCFHGDLRYQNFICQQEQVFVIDFGKSEILPHTQESKERLQEEMDQFLYDIN